MPWFRLDDSFHSHPKVIAAGNEAVGLFVRCGAYCAQHLTDGFVPEQVMLLYGSRELADALVRAKLVRRVRGGWQIPDYLDYNPSAQTVDNERKAKTERQKRWREARGRRPVDASTGASRDASVDGAPTPSRPAPKEAGRDGSRPGERPTGRASPEGSPVRALRPWCGECDEKTRQREDPEGRPYRCPSCHPLAEEAG
jgi:hypothetical protein